MAMNFIRHGTKRAGFKDWPTYNKVPGVDEPHIAKCAYLDPEWVEEPHPRRYDKGKTPTGEKFAEKYETQDCAGVSQAPWASQG